MVDTMHHWYSLGSAPRQQPGFLYWEYWCFWGGTTSFSRYKALFYIHTCVWRDTTAPLLLEEFDGLIARVPVVFAFDPRKAVMCP